MFLNQSFELKSGNLSHTCVRIKEIDLAKFEEDFISASKQAPRLFQNGSFIIEFLFDDFITSVKLKRIRKIIESVGANMIGIKSNSPAQVAENRKAHIGVIHENKTQSSSPSKKREIHKAEKKGLMVQKKIRSGTQIYAKNKDLIVCGDVSHGSEIIASGNIFIYGALYGKAIAGADGNTDAQIFCHLFAPELISIAGLYIVSEDISPDFCNKSVQVRINEEKIEMNVFNAHSPAKQY